MKKSKRILVFVGISVIVVFVFALLFNPFQYNPSTGWYEMSVETEVGVPVESAFNYLGNSDNAKYWSVFIEEIKTLNPEVVADGQVGSIRRCFCKKESTGEYWDEEILEVVPGKRRTLSIYNLTGFPVGMSGLITEQLYTDISLGQCTVAFKLHRKKEGLSGLDIIKLKLAGYYINRIFRQNIENVKSDLELKGH